MPCITLIKVKQLVYTLATLIFHRSFCRYILNSKFQRVRLSRCGVRIPLRNTIHVHAANLVRIGCFGNKTGKSKVIILNGRIDHTVKFYFVIIGIRLLIPGRFKRIGRYVFVGSLHICRSRYRSGMRQQMIFFVNLIICDSQLQIIINNIKNIRLNH